MIRIPVPNEDTIAALATPDGSGGIAVIRISGPLSFEIVDRVFKGSETGLNSGQMHSHRLYHGHVHDFETGELLDEVMCVLMKSPHSYTGEDVAEIHSHGGYVVPKRILDLLYSADARPAEPGEFSLRAFLNGKMDLTQAEAVVDIVNAETEEGLKQAELQLEGILSARISDFKDTVLDILAEVEAQVDFPEEEIDPIVKETLISRSKGIISDIEALLDTFEEGRIIKYGVKTAILGKPNVGKSSLLNRLLMKDRAIVSPLPGTTRDFIEEGIDVRGIPLRLVDTAGIRITSDEIEKTGVNLAKKIAEEAEMLILVIDGSQELDGDDMEVLKLAEGKKSLLAINKSDIETRIQENKITALFPKGRIVYTSAKLGHGIEGLKDKTREIIIGSSRRTEASELVLTQSRHKYTLEKAEKSIQSFLELLDGNESPEFLALELRVALDSLGELTGEVTTEDVLGRIFSKFCVGK